MRFAEMPLSAANGLPAIIEGALRLVAAWPGEMRALVMATAAACLVIALRGWRDRFLVGLDLARHQGFATVYVFQDARNPRFLKIGATRRASRIRKSEVSRTMAAGNPLRQVFAVDMPFGFAAEKVAHRRLRSRNIRWRFWHRRRGREWFRARGRSDVNRVKNEVVKAAADVRRLARRKRLWPRDGDATARIFDPAAGRRRPARRPLVEQLR